MIHRGDLFDVLPMLPEASIDACVTDPPYELDFMGKHWDSTGVAFQVDTWRQVWRVLKPGAYLVAFGGTRTSHRMVSAIEDGGFEIRDSLCWLYGQGFPKNYNLGDGKGTALKPAHEPIALAWKPFRGTIKACHQTHGTAALNIDACRIEHAGESLDGGHISSRADGWDRPWKSSPDAIERALARGRENLERAQNLGRWPANVLLDEEAAAMLDEQSGEWHTATQGQRGEWNANSVNVGPTGLREHGLSANYSDFGGASRFYYVAKPSREERNAGTDRNHHPTVKPVELMRWLVRLVTPPGGVVLDPFMGSGTTGMACRYELRQFIGIEREEEYATIAERRIAAVAPLFGDERTA